MSLIVSAAVVAGGIAMGRYIARRLRDRRPIEGDENDADIGPAVPKSDPFEDFGAKLGDVVVRRAGHEEAWLAGALVLREEKPVAALFIAPEAGGDRAVFARPGAGTLGWLGAMAKADVPTEGEPPYTLELGGTRFERARRLPVHVNRVGTGAPNVGEKAVVAEYEGPGDERVVFVIGAQGSSGWRGVALSEGEYDVLPGGKATLDAD